MTTVEIRVEQVFKKVFETDIIDVLDKNISPEWDSLKHIELILELEDEFDIEFTNIASSEIFNFNSCVKTILETV